MAERRRMAVWRRGAKYRVNGSVKKRRKMKSEWKCEKRRKMKSE